MLLSQDVPEEQDTAKIGSTLPYSDFVQIKDLFEASRVVNHSVIQYTPDATGAGIEERPLRTPIPRTTLPDLPHNDRLSDDISEVWALYCTVAGPAWERWIRTAFKKPVPSINVQSEAGLAMADVMRRFNVCAALYRKVTGSSVAEWLTQNPNPDSWTFQSETIGDQPFANLLRLEVVNLVSVLILFPYAVGS